MIKASGFGAERFMNMVSYRGVYLWDVEQKGAGVYMRAPMNSIGVLQACQEKTGCRMEVLGYGGLPSKLRRFHGRQMLIAGVILFLAGLYVLSSFIWTIEIEGTERLGHEEIRLYCERLELKPGTWKKRIDTEEATKKLLAHFPDISWISIGIDGTTAIIKLTEIIEETEIVDKGTPTDIIAVGDGVIVKITVERGTPVMQEGDVVQRGDVLISSEIVIGLEGEEQYPEYVAAEGLIHARQWLKMSGELPLTYQEKVYLEEDENTVIIINGKEVDIIYPSMSTIFEKEVLVERQLALGDFILPITWRKEKYIAYEMEERSRTVQEAKKELEEIIREKFERMLSIYGTIEDITIRYYEYADKVTAEAQAVMIEQIGEKRYRRDTNNDTNGESITNGQSRDFAGIWSIR